MVFNNDQNTKTIFNKQILTKWELQDVSKQDNICEEIIQILLSGK